MAEIGGIIFVLAVAAYFILPMYFNHREKMAQIKKDK